MNQTKPAYASTSVWGAVFALASALAPVALAASGVRSPADQQAAISTVSQVAAAAGAAVALYGRLKATKRIAS